MVFSTGPYTVLPDSPILITANMQSETGFPSSHQLKSYVASKSRLKLAARAVLSADARLLVFTSIQISLPSGNARGTSCWCFYSALQCSHCKRAVLATAIPSVRLSVRLSVTRRYCAKMTAHSTVQFALSIAKCVWFCRNQKIFPRDDPYPLKSWFKVTHLLLKAARFDMFCLVVCQR